MSELKECKHETFEFCICTGCNKDVLEVHKEQKQRIADLEARLADSVVMPEEMNRKVYQAIEDSFQNHIFIGCPKANKVYQSIRKALSEGK